MKHPLLLLLIFVLLYVAGCTGDASPTATPTHPIPASPTPTITPEPAPPTPTPVSPPESFSENKSQLVREGYNVDKGKDGWRITAKNEKDKKVEVATAVSEEKIAITLNGEIKEFSQEAFVPMILNGDTVYLLTIQENGENVDYFYIKETGEWVTPVKIQRNPEDIDGYTIITPEDIWSGRVLFSEILEAEDEPFPEGTFVPIAYVYHVGGFVGGDAIIVNVYRAGEKITKENDYERWFAFYKLETPNGGKQAIGTKRVLYTDGESSVFFHMGFDWEWLGEEGREWVIEDFFMARERGGIVGLRPVIYFAGPCKNATILNAQPNSACVFYGLPNNNPASVRDDLVDRIEIWLGGSSENNVVGNEIFDFQKMILPPF